MLASCESAQHSGRTVNLSLGHVLVCNDISIQGWYMSAYERQVCSAGFASTRAAALKQPDELPASSLPALDGQKPKVAGLLGQKAGGKVGAAYSEALSAEGKEALRQAVKQLRRTLFSTDQLRLARALQPIVFCMHLFLVMCAERTHDLTGCPLPCPQALILRRTRPSYA